MDAADLKSCSDVFLHVIEEHGFAGHWKWTFASGEQRWSRGFFRLLGLDPHRVDPAYDLFLDLVHPEDRVRLAGPGEVMQGHVSPRALVRLIRPTGEWRNLSVLSELRVSSDGRPLSLSGVALDVTDRERLTQIQALERRRRQALYLTSYATTYAVSVDRIHDFPAEVAQVHGWSLNEINRNPFVMIVPEERAAFRDRAMQVHDPRTVFQGTAHERLANGEVWRFRIIGVPLWNEDGEYLGRAGLKYPILPSGDHVRQTEAPEDVRLRRALEQAVQGYHLRAARGLLGWSMTTLAEASGLSLSTVRRLEENAEQQGARSRHRAVQALRAAGIRFITLDDGTIAVATA
ncbi:helix-turn-helix domain-containing protein [Methylobacterium nonmethylotrophicum]|uniref:Histidine kinase n=1 Tax=Methylobacterium nonmethylotrophicum TaxID=1141884 RepID=A0A4Z0NI34_9HYPH|nr:helix-turn-helix transcriptional regulator [Methylobacterium nonmethylotrophicum]TGD95890.1 histidine kinase [Methylobacterium nonmethylotrophicum]